MSVPSASGKPGTEGGLALGFDAGSVALKVVVTEASGEIVAHWYRRTSGRPVETALCMLEEVVRRYGSQLAWVAGTGSAGRLLCELLDIPFVNEVICQATAIRRLHPEARTLIEMGGQDSKLVFLPDEPGDPRAMVDFSMNTNCAAGTGSFLDQQASRLGVAIEEFGQLALKSVSPPRVAGRCSVFAKSDMIHLQQQATPVHDIIAGLCFGLARNLKSNLGRGRELARPIAFCGGVAANAGVVRAIREVFELGQGELIVPQYHAVTGALGAAWMALPEPGGPGGPLPVRIRLEALEEYLRQKRIVGYRLPPLSPPSDGRPHEPACDLEAMVASRGGQPVDAYLGLDVGSISTKIAVIDSDNRVLAKVYLMTAGRPLEAVQRALREIRRQVGDRVRIRGAATTGSGRYLTGEFIGADLVINEITAQATAAALLDPEVDTIFEIGGQDSKYISLDQGVVVDFEMNHACAAGTGSFLEEQAERLGINIQEQFAQLALGSRCPVRLGERCTVFMESDLLSYLQQGASTEDLVAGLAHSIVANYINRVVGHRRIGRRIFFQGGTAFNRGVVAAFEKVTGRNITVPPHHEVTGAIGAAVLARRHQEALERTESRFGGFDLADLHYEVRSFPCEHCSNHCEISEVILPGRAPLYHGSRCDRYNVKKEQRPEGEIPNLFAERHRLLVRYAHRARAPARGPTVGLPLALSNYQLLPLWGTLLTELGCRVVVSQVSTPGIIHRGVEAVLSTPCFPVKVAHGHVLELLDKGVDYVWLPSVVNLPQDDASQRFNQLCPYVTSIPYQISAVVGSEAHRRRLLTPAVPLQHGPRALVQSLQGLCRILGVGRSDVRRAVAAAWQAQQEFEEACRARGRQVLESLRPEQPAMVLVSRPYNGCDPGVNLDVPGKLRKLGVLAIPMDFLDLRARSDPEDRVFAGMYWKYGQRILRAGKIIRDDPRLHAVYLSNFSCGPDSFLIGYFKRTMAPKPSLVLEIDEHSADAGVVTRLEAFLESLRGFRPERVPPAKPLYPASCPARCASDKPLLYIPYMGDVSLALRSAFRAAGQPAEVMSPGDAETLELGRRYTTGKECLPCIITAGDMLRTARQPDFDPLRSAFFMPGGSGPCRFGQYHCLHKLLLSDAGFPQVPVVSISQDAEMYQQSTQFGNETLLAAWRGSCAMEFLLNAVLAIRPYETEPGRADAVYQSWRDRLAAFLETAPTTEALARQLEYAVADLLAVPVDRRQPRPRIGIVGEIYVRHHPLANNQLIRRLERFGAECMLAGFSEWIYYTNWTRKLEARQRRQWRTWFTAVLKDRAMRRTHRRLSVPFEPILGKFQEPTAEEILDLAEPYIHPSFQGEAVLSVGKMVEMARHGCHGVVNVGPFSCMPSTIVAGVMKHLASRLGDLPMLSLSFDGQQDPTLDTRLEAFMHQAQTYQRSLKERSARL